MDENNQGLQWSHIEPAVFHSVSGFCNAGFSLFADNLNVVIRGVCLLVMNDCADNEQFPCGAHVVIIWT